jgi:hypothetical protein
MTNPILLLIQLWRRITGDTRCVICNDHFVAWDRPCPRCWKDRQ